MYNTEGILVSGGSLDGDINTITLPTQYKVDIDRLIQTGNIDCKLNLLLKLLSNKNLVVTEDYLFDSLMEYVREI